MHGKRKWQIALHFEFEEYLASIPEAIEKVVYMYVWCLCVFAYVYVCVRCCCTRYGTCELSVDTKLT